MHARPPSRPDETTRTPAAYPHAVPQSHPISKKSTLHRRVDVPHRPRWMRALPIHDKRASNLTAPTPEASARASKEASTPRQRASARTLAESHVHSDYLFFRPIPGSSTPHDITDTDHIARTTLPRRSRPRSCGRAPICASIAHPPVDRSLGSRYISRTPRAPPTRVVTLTRQHGDADPKPPLATARIFVLPPRCAEACHPPAADAHQQLDTPDAHSPEQGLRTIFHRPAHIRPGLGSTGAFPSGGTARMRRQTRAHVLSSPRRRSHTSPRIRDTSGKEKKDGRGPGDAAHLQAYIGSSSPRRPRTYVSSCAHMRSPSPHPLSRRAQKKTTVTKSRHICKPTPHSRHQGAEKDACIVMGKFGSDFRFELEPN
ncbi:hypothetical protein C8J57DRAFT_1229565 [Mycena rebaudengoi]|nr:hypothetical protein C8J57DRAFT_1229565 [Mycena rebaudengoi]